MQKPASLAGHQYTLKMNTAHDAKVSTVENITQIYIHKMFTPARIKENSWDEGEASVCLLWQSWQDIVFAPSFTSFC